MLPCLILIFTENKDSAFGSTVKFPAGTTSVLLNISIINDDVFEGNESFTLSFRENLLPDYVLPGENYTATVTIIDFGEPLI